MTWQGWPACLQVEEEANKLTFGQPREIQTPQMQGILEMKAITGSLEATLLNTKL